MPVEGGPPQRGQRMLVKSRPQVSQKWAMSVEPLEDGVDVPPLREQGVSLADLVVVSVLEVVRQPLVDQAERDLLRVEVVRVVRGRDPVPVIERTLALLRDRPLARVIWARPRELLNIFQADAVGCHVITATSDLLGKLPLVDKDLTGYSLETVEMFHRDAMAAGYSIPLSAETSTSL